MKTTLRLSLIMLLCIVVCLFVVPAAYAETVVDSGTCGAQGDNLTWMLYDNGDLVIEGTGEMKEYAFVSMRDIKKVVVKEGVTSIGDFAFTMTGLKNLSIPSSVTHIGNFGFCSGLTSISVDSANPSFCDIDGVLFSKDMSTLMRYPAQKQGDYIIPSGVSSIRESAFSYCIGLTSVTIPNSVTSIGSKAFTWDGISPIKSHLETIFFLGSPPSISNSAFWAIIATAYYPADKGWTVDHMQNCGGKLTWKTKDVAQSGTWGNLTWNLNEVGTLAISGSGEMNDFSLSSAEAWHAYDSDVKVVMLNPGVTSIGDYAFSNCRFLRSITIPDSVTTIGDGSFDCCSALTSVSIPDSVTSIGDYAFDSCYSLMSVSIPDSVTSIGQQAFDGCSSLTSITIPEGVTAIEHTTFYTCTALTSVTIPESVTSIAGDAFGSCRKLSEIIFHGAPPIISGSAFTNVTANAYYPANKGWTAANMKNYGGNLTWIPSGTVPDFILPANLTSIEEEAFAECAFTYIGPRAFADCPNLAYIYIPEATRRIDPNAFGKTNNLTIIGKDGSYAEFYAQKYGFTFEAVS